MKYEIFFKVFSTLCLVLLSFSCIKKNTDQDLKSSSLNAIENLFTSKSLSYKKLDFNVNDVAALDINGDQHRDFIFISEPAIPGKKQQLATYFGNDNGEIKLQKNFPIENNFFEHIRNWKVFNGKFLALIDHGIDQEPFLGGFSKIYQITREGIKFIHPEKKQRSFTFDICPGNFSGNSELELYYSNIDAGELIKPHILTFKDKKWRDSKIKLPTEIEDFNLASIACRAFNFNNDKLTDLAIGTGKNQNGSSSYDYLLLMKKKDTPKLLPFPKKHPGWTSSAILNADFNNDSFEDLLVLSHDFKMSRGAISLFINQKGTALKPISILSSPEIDLPYWYSRPLKVDLNNDGYLDFLVLPKPTRKLTQKDHKFSLLALINQKGQSFKALPFSSKLFNNRHLAGYTAYDYDQDGDQDIFAFHYGINEYTILINKNSDGKKQP